MAEIKHVGPPDPNKLTSAVIKEKKNTEQDAQLAAHANCFWDGKQYSDGALLCAAGRRLECWNGRWVDVGNC